MRFGAFVPQGWRMDLVGVEPDRQWEVMKRVAQRLDERPEWESLWVYDHFHTVPDPTSEATHEAWSLMAAFAASTSRIRLGQMCTCTGYRNPAYLAKVAATVDVVSGGRVEMGIGGGWYEHEWRAYGYGFPPVPERLGALRDAVEIFRQMWTAGVATHAGRYASVDGAICAPRPLQGTSVAGSPRNGIPVWVAGGGEKVTLRIAARYADYTNFFGDAEQFARKSAILDQHCADVGRDPSEVTRSSNLNVLVGRTAAEVDEKVRWYADQVRAAGMAPERAARFEAAQRRDPGSGTPDQIVAHLRALEAVGMGYTIAYFPDAGHDPSGMELFEREVIPQLRE